MKNKSVVITALVFPRFCTILGVKSCSLRLPCNLIGSFNFTVPSNCFYSLFKTEVLVSASTPRRTVNLGFMTEVQMMMMGLKVSMVLTIFPVIRLTEFTGLPCTINTHKHKHTHICAHMRKSDREQHLFSRRQLLLEPK